jgi:kinesin family member 15
MTSPLSTLAPVGDAIKVLVRVRPLKQNEPPSPVVTVHGQNVVALTDPSKSEPYSVKVDHVLGPSSSQQDVFATIGETTVQHCLEGFNSSIFAYGMTGSGKTHTMLGASSRMPDGSLDQLCGLAPRVFDALFAAITQREQGVPSATDPTSLRFTVKCSFLEIYNEEVTDLLDPAATGLQIRDGDSKRGIYVQGLSETEVLNGRMECVDTVTLY